MSMVPSQIWQSPMLFALIYHDRGLLLLLSLMKVWMVPLVFRTENSTNKLKCGLIWVQHTFPLSSWLRWAVAQRTRRHHCIELMNIFLLELQRSRLHFLIQQQTVLKGTPIIKTHRPKYATITLSYKIHSYKYIKYFRYLKNPQSV